MTDPYTRALERNSPARFAKIIQIRELKLRKKLIARVTISNVWSAVLSSAKETSAKTPMLMIVMSRSVLMSGCFFMIYVLIKGLCWFKKLFLYGELYFLLELLLALLLFNFLLWIPKHHLEAFCTFHLVFCCFWGRQCLFQDFVLLWCFS